MIRFATLIVAFALACPCCCAAQIVVGVQDFLEYLPYSRYDKSTNEYTGFNRELLDLFGRKNDYTFTYRALPVKRLYRDFLAAKVDLKYPDNPYWSAEVKKNEDIRYSKPVVNYIDGVLVSHENNGRGLAAIKRLGVAAGFTPFLYLPYISSGQIVMLENPSLAGLLKQIALKRIDGAYCNVSVAEYYKMNLPEKYLNIVFDPTLPHTKATRHLSSFKRPDIVDQFDEFLRTHAAEVEALKQKYQVEAGLPSE
jgi:polar amino acid transport system substrate-binding protein